MKIEKTSPMGLVEYDENFWTGKRTIKINGVLLTKKDKKTYIYNDGNERKSITVKGVYVSGITLIMDGVEVELEEKPKWYEYLFMILILVGGIAFIGGAVGGAIGGILAFGYMALSKPQKNPAVKIALGIGAIAALVVAFFALVLILAPLYA